MYCTGGIRCEKASAYFKYKLVTLIEGGIIEYTRQVKAKGLDNKFRGKTLCLINVELRNFNGLLLLSPVWHTLIPMSTVR